MFAIKSNGFGSFGENFFKKIGRMNINMLKKTANPLIVIKNVRKEGFKRGMATTGNALINPLSVSGEKVMVGSYNIAGTRALKKTITGATSGFATGGIYGAVAGAAAANLKKGKENIGQSAVIGAAAGLAAGAASGSGAGGTLVSNISGSQWMSGLSAVSKLSGEQTNQDYNIDPYAYDAEYAKSDNSGLRKKESNTEAGIINPKSIILTTGLAAFAYAIYKIYETRPRK